MPLIPALLVFALLVEISAVIYCAARGIVLGRAFRFSMWFQFVVGPAAIFLGFVVWDIAHPIPPDVEPLGPRFSHQMDFLGAMSCCILASTAVAACLGGSRFFVNPKSQERQK